MYSKSRHLLKPILALILLFFIYNTTYATDINGLLEMDKASEDIKKELDLEYIEEAWQELESEFGSYLPDFSWQELIDWATGGGQALNPLEILNGLLRYLWREVIFNLRLLGKLITLSVISALLKNLHTAFASERVSTLSRSAVFMVLLIIAMQSFQVAAQVGEKTINDMADFVLALIPLLLILLASLGNVVSVAIFNPLIVFSVNFFATLIREFVFPLIFFSIVLTILNHLASQYKVSLLAGFLKNIGMWTLGLTLTIFTGLTAIQGVGATAGNAIGMRTAKYATGAFIPVVGGMLTSVVETVAGASLILKNGISIMGIVILLLISFFPLIKIFALILVYKFAAAVVQPLGETELSDCLNNLSNCLAMVMAAVATVSMMFIIAVLIVVGAGNVFIMMR